MYKLEEKDFNWYGFKLDKALKQLSATKYLGTFCIKGAYKPAAVFYSANPDLSKGHKPYPFLFTEGDRLYVGGMTEEEFEKERYQTGAHCHSCKATIYSVNRHDFRSCACNEEDTHITVDGGKDYFRFLWGKKASYDYVNIDFKTGQIEKTEDTRNSGDIAADKKAAEMIEEESS